MIQSRSTSTTSPLNSVNRTEEVTAEVSLAIENCLNNFLSSHEKRLELLRWYEASTTAKASPDDWDFDHPIYRSFLIWMPEDINVAVERLYVDHSNLVIHGHVWFEAYECTLYFGFRHFNERLQTRFSALYDENFSEHRSIDLDEAKAYHLVTKIRSSYSHLGLPQST